MGNFYWHGDTNIEGQLRIVKGKLDNEIILGSCVIKERFNGTNSIGFDFMVG